MVNSPQIKYEMNDKINGIIVDGKVYTGGQNGDCKDCDAEAICLFAYGYDGGLCFKLLELDKNEILKFSQELTDKLNGKTDAIR